MTPEEWRAELLGRLARRAPAIRHFESYYDGDHRLAFTTKKFREAFGDLFSALSDNWCGVVVDASVERLEVQGFRYGDDDEADSDAWAIWQANGLDAEITTAFETSVATGYGYLLVSPGDDGGPARITVEHPLEMIVAHMPGDRRRRAAALKSWVDEEGHALATLYLPGAVHKWRSERPLVSQGEQHARLEDALDPQRPKDPERGWRPVLAEQPTEQLREVRWAPRDDETDEDGFAGVNPAGRVPVVPLLNRPTMAGLGRSDLKSAVPIQDAVNKLCADMIVASEFAAFRQRWASGIEVPRDPETGEPVRKVFDAAIDRMFATPNAEAKFGSFEASDLSNYVSGVEMWVQHLAAQTRTPPHYLLGQSGAFPSGESLKSTETGLVAKVRRKQVVFGEALEETLRLAFRFAKPDDDRAESLNAETLWRDPESRSEGELVDGLTKLATIGVPRRALWERLGASPQQIARWETLVATESLQAAAADFTRTFGPGGQGVPAETTPPATGG